MYLNIIDKERKICIPEQSIARIIVEQNNDIWDPDYTPITLDVVTIDERMYGIYGFPGTKDTITACEIYDYLLTKLGTDGIVEVYGTEETY